MAKYREETFKEKDYYNNIGSINNRKYNTFYGYIFYKLYESFIYRGSDNKISYHKYDDINAIVKDKK